MTTKTFLSIFFSMTFLMESYGQLSVSGIILDSRSKTPLPGANFYIVNTKNGTVSDSLGHYQFSYAGPLPVHLKITFTGYSDTILTWAAAGNYTMNIYLTPGIGLHEITITESPQTKLSNPDISSFHLDIKTIDQLPKVGGATDIVRIMHLLPGVQSGTEGNADMIVRGGSKDQNLILMDGTPIYHLNHMGGFVSVFNPDIIQSATIYTGGFPASYSGRLSSVLEVGLIEGDRQNFNGSFTISPLATGAMINGPFQGGKGSYVVSARRFMLDIFTRPISKIAFEGVSIGYTFYDINAKVKYDLSDKDVLTLNLYDGDDKLSTTLKDHHYQGDSRIDEKFNYRLQWGNRLAALKWERAYNQKLHGSVSVSNSRFRYLNRFENSSHSDVMKLDFLGKFTSSIDDTQLKKELSYTLPRGMIKGGVQRNYFSFKPGVNSIKFTDIPEDEDTTGNVIRIDTTFGSYYQNSVQNRVYLEWQQNFSQRVKSNAGLSYAIYSSGGILFHSPEPRVILSYLLTPGSTIKLGYSRMMQPMHFLTSTGMGLPSDLWLPATDRVPPQTAYIFVAGYSSKIPILSGIDFSAEVYYKSMSNLIEYKNGTNIIYADKDWQDLIEQDGKGTAYGLELLFRKDFGKYKGWVGYSLAWSNRLFENLNDGVKYPFKYDRRHNIDLVAIRSITENINFSFTWVFSSGHAYTMADGKYLAMDYHITDWNKPGLIFHEVYNYPSRNNFRMKNYHRMDIGLDFKKIKENNRVRIWNVSIYNAYNNMNPTFHYFWYDQNGNQKVYAMMLFPIIPSVSYTLKF